MSGNIIKLGSNGNNSQKMVFSMLVAILLLEFGSFTKLQRIWQLAFTASTPSTPTTASTNAPLVNVSPNTHPTPNVGMQV
jgi:hypothetical protein